MQKLKEFLALLRDNAVGVLVVLLIALFIYAMVRMDYAAYRQKYPDAAPWTFFFDRK